MDTLIIDEVPGSDPGLAATLAAAGLPVHDLAEPGRTFFRFTDGDRLAGYIGWEPLGAGAVLLRSLVVDPGMRGRGLGAVMTRWALDRLGELGFTDAWALTTTIEALAVRLGFETVDRAAAPPAIRQSRQFAALCPASAVLLRKAIM